MKIKIKSVSYSRGRTSIILNTRHSDVSFFYYYQVLGILPWIWYLPSLTILQKKKKKKAGIKEGFNRQFSPLCPSSYRLSSRMSMCLRFSSCTNPQQSQSTADLSINDFLITCLHVISSARMLTPSSPTCQMLAHPLISPPLWSPFPNLQRAVVPLFTLP